MTGAVILCVIAFVFAAAIGWVIADAYEREWRWGGWSVVAWAVLCSSVWIVGFSPVADSPAPHGAALRLGHSGACNIGA